MKTLILLILALPAYAAHKPDISAVRVHENTMVVSGSSLAWVHHAKLGGKVVRVVDDEDAGDGHWLETVISPGNPALLAEMSGVTVTEDQAAAIFSLCDVTTENLFDALERLGLVLITSVSD